MFKALIDFVREQYRSNDFIPLHAPVFSGHERQYVVDTIDSTFVSSVGAYVDRFERDMAAYTASPRAVATMNGTQPLIFVATCNAIAYCGAEPVFIDVDRDTLGLSPQAMEEWLQNHAHVGDDGVCRTRTEGRAIRACLPMHTFGHPANLAGLLEVTGRWKLALVEDAAESLGSLYMGRHTGTFGLLGTLSFNGNKIITTGGGGMILADETLGVRAKYITTTAKRPHPYEYFHDEVGYNYRLPNINAALGCAQLEQLETFVANKRELASRYAAYFSGSDMQFVTEPTGCRSNYWLNAVVCDSLEQREALLKSTNDSGVMTRPIWALMNRLPSYAQCLQGPLTNAEWLESRVVNLPSSVLPN